jgi:hypothetical protein
LGKFRRAHKAIFSTRVNCIRGGRLIVRMYAGDVGAVTTTFAIDHEQPVSSRQRGSNGRRTYYLSKVEARPVLDNEGSPISIAEFNLSASH